MNPTIQVKSYCRNPLIPNWWIPTVAVDLNWWIPIVAVGLNWLCGSYFMNFGPFGLIFDLLRGFSVKIAYPDLFLRHTNSLGRIKTLSQ